MSDIIENYENSKFVYVLHSEIGSYKQSTLINSACSSMPDESEIKDAELKVVGVDEEPGNVVILGLGEASWDMKNIDDLLDIRIEMHRKLLYLWGNIEEMLSKAGFSKERIDEIVAENEEPIRKMRSRFELT